jgi:hypothetical protein
VGKGTLQAFFVSYGETRRGSMRARIGKLSLAAAGVVVGVLLLGPVSAHVNDSFNHLWEDHIRPKADDRYVNHSQNPWARIASNGDVIDEEGLVDADPPAPTGDYTLEFNRRVGNRCAGTATSWTEDLIASIQELENKHFVEVELVNTLNNGVNGGFSVIFRC